MGGASSASIGVNRCYHRPIVMNRRGFLQTVSLSVLAAPLAIEAQPSGKVYRLGILLVARQQSAETIGQSFSERLRERGWQPGRNLTIDVRYTEAPERLGALARCRRSVSATSCARADYPTGQPSWRSGRSARRRYPCAMRS